MKLLLVHEHLDFIRKKDPRDFFKIGKKYIPIKVGDKIQLLTDITWDNEDWEWIPGEPKEKLDIFIPKNFIIKVDRIENGLIWFPLDAKLKKEYLDEVLWIDYNWFEKYPDQWKKIINEYESHFIRGLKPFRSLDIGIGIKGDAPQNILDILEPYYMSAKISSSVEKVTDVENEDDGIYSITIVMKSYSDHPNYKNVKESWDIYFTTEFGKIYLYDPILGIDKKTDIKKFEKITGIDTHQFIDVPFIEEEIEDDRSEAERKSDAKWERANDWYDEI